MLIKYSQVLNHDEQFLDREYILMHELFEDQYGRPLAEQSIIIILTGGVASIVRMWSVVIKNSRNLSFYFYKSFFLPNFQKMPDLRNSDIKAFSNNFSDICARNQNCVEFQHFISKNLANFNFMSKERMPEPAKCWIPAQKVNAGTCQKSSNCKKR